MATKTTCSGACNRCNHHCEPKLNAGNIKTGKGILTWSKLYGNEEIYIKRLDMVVAGTCGGYCDGCKRSCYVRKSYRYDSVKYRHALNTLAIRNDLKACFTALQNQIKRKRIPVQYVRIHQSGEFETVDEFMAWIDTARMFPAIKFFVYTKAFDIVIPALLAGLVPTNFIVLISIWHEYGIAEYNRVAYLPNVKAFVYDDHDFDYTAAGLIINTSCHAYSENGKLDHNVTCDKCKKCIRCTANTKVIRCPAHD